MRNWSSNICIEVDGIHLGDINYADAGASLTTDQNTRHNSFEETASTHWHSFPINPFFTSQFVLGTSGEKNYPDRFQRWVNKLHQVWKDKGQSSALQKVVCFIFQINAAVHNGGVKKQKLSLNVGFFIPSRKHLGDRSVKSLSGFFEFNLSPKSS